MPGELGLPFDPKKTPVEGLREIAVGNEATTVAIKHASSLLTLNVNDLRGGDVFLFRRPDGGSWWKWADPIERYQSLLLTKEAARWRHVAILDGNFLVWDAMPKLDVRVRPLREVLRENQTITVVRPKAIIDPNRLSTSLLMFSDHDYRMFRLDTGGALANRLIYRLAPDQKQAKAPEEGSVICSIFVSNVLRRCTTAPFFRPLAITVPGDFAQDAMFDPVPIDWCRIRI